MKQLVAKANEEAGLQREDQLELNQREKDEGDLFGVRAIEAGFYAGIPQSRPTSRAGSFAGTPSMSSHNLLSGYKSPNQEPNSMASSVTDPPLAHTNRRDSATLASGKSTPAIRLAPSDAEISGRHNHTLSPNMNLTASPSPVLVKSPRSPTFDDESEVDYFSGRTSPSVQKPQHYAPLPLPEVLQGSSGTQAPQPRM
jgi:hypothetical protein